MVRLSDMKAALAGSVEFRTELVVKPGELGALIELAEATIAWEVAKRDAEVIRRHLGGSQVEQIRNVVAAHDRDEAKCRERYLNALDKVQL